VPAARVVLSTTRRVGPGSKQPRERPSRETSTDGRGQLRQAWGLGPGAWDLGPGTRDQGPGTALTRGKDVLLGYLVGKGDHLPVEVVRAVEALASRAHNRLQTGWNEEAMRSQ